MSAGLSITFTAFKFLSLFVSLVGKIGAGVISGGFKRSGLQLKPEISDAQNSLQ